MGLQRCEGQVNEFCEFSTCRDSEIEIIHFHTLTDVLHLTKTRCHGERCERLQMFLIVGIRSGSTPLGKSVTSTSHEWQHDLAYVSLYVELVVPQSRG